MMNGNNYLGILCICFTILQQAACYGQASTPPLVIVSNAKDKCVFDVFVKRGNAVYLAADSQSKTTGTSARKASNRFVLVSVPQTYPKEGWTLRVTTSVTLTSQGSGNVATYHISWAPIDNGIRLLGLSYTGSSSIAMNPSKSAVAQLSTHFQDSHSKDPLLKPVQMVLTDDTTTVTTKLLVEVKDAATILSDVPFINQERTIPLTTLLWAKN
jgi:hypothetical protein